VATAFEHLLIIPPPWVPSTVGTDPQGHIWLPVSERLGSIVRTLREPENAARAVIRWNPKSEILSEDEEDAASTPTEMEDSDKDMSETTHRGDEDPRLIMAGWLRGLFRRRKTEQREEIGSLSEETKTSDPSDESETSSSDSSSSSDSLSSSDSSRDSDKEDEEDARRRFMEGKGGCAGLYSCSAAFDI
jgi:hypothetical protein